MDHPVDSAMAPRPNAELERELAAALEQLAAERRRSADEVAAVEASLRADLEEQRQLAERAEEYRIEAADMRSMFDAMQHRIDVLQARAAQAADSKSGGDAVESELREQIAELEAQRRALAEEVEAERGARAALERAAREREDLDASGDDVRAQLASLQTVFDSAVAKHAEETRTLREDAELHKALVRERDAELSRLGQECSILQQSVEDTVAELEGVRAERHHLSEQLSRSGDDEAPADSGGLRLEGDAESASHAPAGDLESMLGLIEDSAVGAGRGVVVVAMDDDATTLDSVERAVANCDGAVLRRSGDGEIPAHGNVQLAVNLASEAFDLNSMSDCGRWGIDEPEAFTYCAKDGRGVFLRRVMFFPPPCDFDECAARLLSGADTLQRVLAVGEDVDFMSGLRESLGRVRTSTAIAFDGRQAVDLIPMVKPQMVLIDLNLPRGGGLRVASQVAANPDLRNVALAMFWSRPIDAALFRQQAVYALRDARIDPEQLTRSMTQMLNEVSSGRGLAFAGAMPAVAVSRSTGS